MGNIACMADKKNGEFLNPKSGHIIHPVKIFSRKEYDDL